MRFTMRSRLSWSLAIKRRWSLVVGPWLETSDESYGPVASLQDVPTTESRRPTATWLPLSLSFFQFVFRMIRLEKCASRKRPAYGLDRHPVRRLRPDFQLLQS